MWTPTSELENATTASSRCPSANVRICWDRAQTTTNWFRLDQSTLDSDAVLTLYTYADGADILEVITDIDNYKYINESDYLISVEGLDELRGDNYQSVISETDLVFSNSTDRYIPKEDKNLLENPSWESNYEHWNIASGLSQQLVYGSGEVASGNNAIRLEKLSASTIANYYSDNYVVSSGRSYVFSVFGLSDDSGWNLTIEAFSSGYNRVGISTKDITLVSGAFSRQYLAYTVPTTASAVRCSIGWSGAGGSIKTAIFDCAQLELGNVPTSFDETFIGDYILPKRPVKISVGITDKPGGAGGESPRFAGLTENIEPTLLKDTVRVHCYDYTSELLDRKVDTISTGMQMYQNYRTDQLIRELGIMGGITESNMSLESGTHEVKFAWFKEGSVWYYMQQLAEAEGGRVFFDEEGMLRFWNRYHIDSNTTSRFNFTFDDNIIDLGYRVDRDEIKNHITVKSNIRELQPNQPVWTLQEYKQIDAGETIEVWANINDQEGGDLPCKNIVEPTAIGDTSYFYANTQPDDSGVDKSTDIELTTWYAFGTAAKMVFTNTSEITLYITDIVLYGEPATIVRPINVEKEDSKSIAIYGRQTLPIENNFIDDITFASGLCNKRLESLRNPLRQVHASVIGVPYLQIGDRVNIQTDYQGTKQDLYIYRNRWQLLDDGEFIQHLDLQP